MNILVYISKDSHSMPWTSCDSISVADMIGSRCRAWRLCTVKSEPGGSNKVGARGLKLVDFRPKI